MPDAPPSYEAATTTADPQSTHHDPLSLLSSPPPPSQHTTLIILNTPIASSPLLQHLWSRAQSHICADGGANRLHDLYANDAFVHVLTPDLVIGDLDSIREDVRAFYARAGTEIRHVGEQESTDMTKAINAANEALPPQDAGAPAATASNIVIMGSLSGRLDQGISMLSDVSRTQLQGQPRAGQRFWIISDTSLAFLLAGPEADEPADRGSSKGGRDRSRARTRTHVIRLCPPKKGHSSEEPIFTRNVSILPILGPAKLTLSGFEYDVSDWDTWIGGPLSSSNHVMAPDGVVTVETTVSVLFTVELGPAVLERTADAMRANAGVTIERRVK